MPGARTTVPQMIYYRIEGSSYGSCKLLSNLWLSMIYYRIESNNRIDVCAAVGLDLDDLL